MGACALPGARPSWLQPELAQTAGSGEPLRTGANRRTGHRTRWGPRVSGVGGWPRRPTDPARRVGGVLLTQILPFCDPAVLALLDAFEQAVYAPRHEA